MLTICLRCGIATAVGVEMGYIGLPSLDETPRGRGKHPLAARLSSGGDADTDETFGCLYSGLRAVGLTTHPIEAYRDFLKAHSGRDHELRAWAEEHEDLPGGGPKPRYRWYRAPRRAPGFVRARVRFSCAKCDELFESAVAEWVRPFEARDLAKDEVARLISRTVRPSEHNIHDAWPFEMVLFDDLADWLKSHRSHVLRIGLVPECAEDARSAPASVAEASAPAPKPWTPPKPPPEGDDRVLGPISPKAVLLLARLHHRDPRQREDAARALASLADPGTLGHLALPLDDPDEGVRVAVVHALAALADARKVRLLGIALLDESEPVREAARQALARENVDTEDALRRAREPRTPLGPRALSGKTGAVDPRHRYRGIAAGTLRSLDDAALVVALLEDYSTDVVCEAAGAAGALRLSDAVRPLCAAARTVAAGFDGDRCLEAILDALARIGDPESLPLLVSAVDHARSSVRDKALAGLAAFKGDAAREPLVAALASKNKETRARAAQMLEERKDPAAVPSLVKALRDEDSHVRVRAALALAAIDDPVGLRAVVSAATAGDARVAEATHVRLIQIGDPRTEPALLEAVKYSGIHDWATTATTYVLSGHPALSAAGKDALARSRRAPAKGVKPVAWGSRPLGGKP